MSEHYLTITGKGGSVVFEAKDGELNVWIAPEGESDGPSVVMAPHQVIAVTRFMSQVRPEAIEAYQRAEGAQGGERR